MTTVDLNTGEFRKDGQPLRELRRYRCIQGHKIPVVGTAIGVDKSAEIHVGDAVLVQHGDIA